MGFFEPQMDLFGSIPMEGMQVLSARDKDLSPFSMLPLLRDERMEEFQRFSEDDDEDEARFQPCYAPPAPPSSKHFQMQPTTVTVDGAAAHDVANRVLDFFEAEATADIKKVRPAKYTLRVDQWQEGSLCALKVRIYQSSGESDSDPTRLSVEFQRRSGCAFAFQSIYQRAADFVGAPFAVNREVLLPPEADCKASKKASPGEVPLSIASTAASWHGSNSMDSPRSIASLDSVSSGLDSTMPW